jgi:hypothetical protein
MSTSAAAQAAANPSNGFDANTAPPRYPSRTGRGGGHSDGDHRRLARCERQERVESGHREHEHEHPWAGDQGLEVLGHRRLPVATPGLWPGKGTAACTP